MADKFCETSLPLVVKEAFQAVICTSALMNTGLTRLGRAILQISGAQEVIVLCLAIMQSSRARFIAG